MMKASVKSIPVSIDDFNELTAEMPNTPEAAAAKMILT
jgi:hypothetical protein